MSNSPALTNWHPASWQSKPATQQPKYADPVKLERAVAALGGCRRWWFPGRSRRCASKLARAQRGEQFLLQGGDCAESFEDCESDKIAKRLKILLQMSLVCCRG
jgi:3-deoxy-7-phosphoheptulonate synthase